MDTQAWYVPYHNTIRRTTLLRMMKPIRNMSVFSPINSEKTPLEKLYNWDPSRHRNINPQIIRTLRSDLLDKVEILMDVRWGMQNILNPL